MRRRPTLSDDGATVSLDVHGATVDEALDLIDAAVVLAAERGRTTLRIVHGHSTSDPHGYTRTIRHALHALLDEGEFPEALSDARLAGVTLLSLDAASPRDTTPIRLTDL